ncbi:MAG: 30S ribosomal protein S4e [Candidatus Aenigmarchaeota archaeon]|nr:30S ribosomal protein S4e [Candidatus Aenigmarchaeota archaeon]
MTQLKRMAAPKFWPIRRKTKKFIVPPMPGAHPSSQSVPLGVALRDILGYARTMEEACTILKKGAVKVDGMKRKSKNFSVGLMDVVSVGSDSYRIIPEPKGFKFHKISGEQSGIKLLRVRGKKTLRGKKLQLSFHDGRTMLADNDGFRTGDVVVFDIQKKSIMDKITFAKGSMVSVVKGHSRGMTGRIEEINVTRSSKPNEVVVSLEKKGEGRIVLPADYVFVIGRDKPVISVSE